MFLSFQCVGAVNPFHHIDLPFLLFNLFLDTFVHLHFLPCHCGHVATVLEVLDAFHDVVSSMAGKKGVTEPWVIANYSKIALVVDEMIQNGVVEQLDKDILQYLASSMIA